MAGTVDISTLFQLSSNDASSAYLCQILGPLGDGGRILPCDASLTSILGTLAGVLNSVLLVVGVFVVLYVTVVGLLKTAHEGEFMGKQWSNMWVPLRLVLGIASLFPMGKGYCIIQVFFMWVVMHGIGAADTLWSTAITYVQTMGSPYGGPSLGNNNLQSLQDLMQATTCDATARISYQLAGPTQNVYHDGNSKYHYCSDNPNNPFCQQGGLSGQQYTTNNNQVSLWLGPNGSCGTVNFCQPQGFDSGANKVGDHMTGSCPTGNDPSVTDMASGIGCVACLAQYNVMQDILTGNNPAYTGSNGALTNYLSFADVGNMFAQIDLQYLEFYNNQDPLSPYPAASSLTLLNIKPFCTAQGIGAGDDTCCVWYGDANKTKCQVQSATLFPYVNAGKPGMFDKTNANVLAVSEIYWPAMQAQFTQGGISSDFMNAASTAYTSAINAAIGTFMTQWNSAHTTGLTDWETAATNAGWMVAGSYYNRMAKMNDTALQNAMPTLTMQAIDPKAAGNHNDLYYYRNNAEAIQTLLGSSSQTTNMPPAVAKLQSQLESSSAGILDSFEGSLTSAANPLAAIHSFGEDLLITGQVLYVAFVVIFFIAILLGGIDPMVLGTGTPRPFWNAVIIFLSNALFPVLIFFIGFCFSFGGMLAFYIPMIPYIVFLVGALGWMLSVIEAVFAAPFVALGILSPGGQHDLLGKSEPAMFMLFNIFMRPSLMIVGMSAAMVVAPVAIKLVNLTFSTAMGTIISNPGPIELIFIIVVYTFIIITVINKVFTLIHVIPERVITWVGGQAAPGGGEAEALQTVKGGAEGAAGRIGGGATGGAETIMAGAAAHKAMQPEKGAATVGDAGGKRSAAGAKVAPKDVAINEFQQKKIDAAEKKKEVDEKAAGKGTEIEMMKPTKPKDKDKP